MKKLILVALMAIGMFAPLVGCGSSKDTPDVADTVLEMNSQKDKTKDALQSMEDNAADIDAVGVDLLE